MLRKLFSLAIIVSIALLYTHVYAQDAERKLVLRQAQESGDTTVALEAYLVGDILEATVYARMYHTKPKIFNIILVGPKIGRLSPRSKEIVYPKAEEGEDIIFPTTDVKGGHIRFSNRTEDKAAKGILTREMARFKVPTKKIMANRGYQIRIVVESMQNPGKQENFTFVLKDFAQFFAGSG